MRRLFLTTCVLALTGCSTVSFQQLRGEDLASKPGSPVGAVYYLPKPYLLVAQLPVTAPPPSGSAENPTPPNPNQHGPNSRGQNAGASDFPRDFGGADAPKGDEGAPAGVQVAGSSDQSFGGTSDGYMIKIVYLPDLTRPMAMSVRAGFGTATLKPTLQNGWMLTGFEAGADSKTAEVLKSIADVVTAYKTPGAAKGGGDRGAPSPDGRAQMVLKPGLYEFKYDYAGRLIALCPVTYFDASGAVQATCPE